MIKIANAVSFIAAAVIASSLAIVMPALAQTSVSVGANIGVQGGVGIHNGANGGAWHGGSGMAPGIFGTVTAVSGDTLTVTNAMRARPMPMQQPGTTATPVATSTVVYTVDASNATVYKGSATTTLSSIATGDTVVVQGTVSGTNVTATVIRDGVVPGAFGGPRMPVKGSFGRGASSTFSSSGSGTAIIQGNGEPVIGGNVTAISGTTLTVTNASNVTYSIDGSSGTIVKNGTSTAFSNIAVGDSVIVQGMVNGNSVTASSIIDQGVKGGASSANASSSKPRGGIGLGLGGFFGAIGGFFQHIFGF